jgi:hypothetical protein
MLFVSDPDSGDDRKKRAVILNHGLDFQRCREMGMFPGLLLKIGMSELID